MTRRQGKTPTKPDPEFGIRTLQQNTPVIFRGGGGRRGRIVCKSESSEYDWLVAWEFTNLQTHELESDLEIWTPAAAEPVTRRGPARATFSIREHRPAHQLVRSRAAIAAKGNRHAG